MKENILSSSNEETNPNIHITPEGLMKEAKSLLNATKPSPELNIVLETSKKIRKIKEGNINYAKPIISQNGNPIIFPNTIVVIQGQSASFKSGVSAGLCSTILKTKDCDYEFCGFKFCDPENEYVVLYCDTERNHNEQFPYALQQIQIKAGYQKSDHPENFKYISLVEIPRKQRYEVLKEYLELLKTETDKPIFIVLDVSTDCIEDFNKTDKSMELIDLMNITINKCNVVFLCLIHENPNSEKARGHFGTELRNKATTVIQTSFEKDSNNNDTDLIKIRYLKCRSTARFSPFYVKYSEDENGLILANENDIQLVLNDRKQKADITLVKEFLETYLGDGSKLNRRVLIDKLMFDLGASEKTIESRLKQFYTDKSILKNADGKQCFLEKDKTNKETKYFLVKSEIPIETEPF